ncbi:hypothetical protein BLNAU_2321 [Blattamonas nauphoetae]|uniref:Uncharacterized protein n=1 Tax=Blattamonas nauphoetae TaxID=2049346 RepID=A0ABQ9YGU8_9EUKA|nr:hypothetical protein BLNAU_2321 [Blattamonas nauphoetae]
MEDIALVTFNHTLERDESYRIESGIVWILDGKELQLLFGTVNRDLNFGGSIISLNNSFLYYHTRGPQTPLSNANIIKENINPGQSDHVSVEYTTSNATNSDTVILTYCNFLDISTTVKGGAIFFDRILSKIHLKHCNFVRDSRSDRLSWCCPERTRSPIGHTTEIHLTNINLTSVTRKAHLSEFDRVHSLVQFTRQLVVQLASELHPQWTSVGDESDDGSVYSDDMDDMPMSSPSTRNPIDSLCTIQFGDALAEALSLLFFALLKEIGQEGASPNTSHFLVAQDSLNITILNKLPILPNFIPDTTSKEYAMKVTGVGRRNWKSGTAFFRILPMLSSLVLSSSTPLPHASFFTALQYHPAVLLFLADHSAAVGAEVQSNLIMWLVNSLFSDVHAIDQGRMDLLRSPLHAAAEGRGEEAAEPQHTRLHAAPVCGRGGAGVGAIPMGQGGGCGAVHVCVGAVGECPVTLHQLYLRQIRLDEPVSPSAHQIAGDQQDESSWSFSHSNAVLHQHPPRPHCPRRVFAVSELLGDEPGTTDATQPLLVAPVLRQQAQDTHLQEERAVFEAKHKVTCLDVVISWRVMTGMSILAPLGDQVDFTQLFTINQCPRASSQNASCCSFSLPPPLLFDQKRCCCSTSSSDSVHIRTAEEMLLFDVELRFRPHPYSRRDASVRRRARRLHLTTTSRSAVEDSDAALRIIYSLALPTPHPHHRSTSSREEHASPDNHPRPHNHQSVREVAALVEKALDKRALNLSRDNRNEMQMAARQNTSAQSPHFTYDPTPPTQPSSPHTHPSSPASTPHAPAARREGHGADRPPPPHPHRHSPPLHLRLPPLLNEFKQAGIHQQSNVEFFQMRMGQKDPAIALVAAQFLKGHSFLRKD